MVNKYFFGSRWIAHQLIERNDVATHEMRPGPDPPNPARQDELEYVTCSDVRKQPFGPRSAKTDSVSLENAVCCKPRKHIVTCNIIQDNGKNTEKSLELSTSANVIYSIL